MPRRFLLPAPAEAPGGRLGARLRVLLLSTWRGRILLAALGVALLQAVQAPVPAPLPGLALLVLGIAVLFGAVRLSRLVLRRLLWRIRSKLILSYLFIALVPVVLLALFFAIAGVLFVDLLASHLVNGELLGIGRTLVTVARGALPGLPEEDAAAAAAFEERLRTARRLHPQLAFSLLRGGRVVASRGGAPRALPEWWKGPELVGLAGREGAQDVFRVALSEGRTAVILDVPMDEALFSDLAVRTGIHVLVKELAALDRTVPARARAPRERQGVAPDGVRVDGSPDSGINGVAMPARVNWATGEQATKPLLFQFHPFELFRRLSPGLIAREAGESRNLADILVYALGAVALVFLVMYAVALALGLLLARSVTRSVHALSRGTERLRQGDFDHPIAVTSRDQLGELAFSFNHMASGLQALLREQAEKERLEEELRIARKIQMSLLPAEGSVSLPGLRIAALCLPAAEVGGDYYDLLPLSKTCLGVLVADVSGKGTSAALYMAELKGLVLSLSRIYASPARLLSEANRILAANMDSRSFITMTYAVVDVGARRMRYARAGHNPIIQLQAATGRTRVLTPPGLGLGLDPGARFEEILVEDDVELRSGDVFLFFTDGLSEAMSPTAELFGENRLRTIIEQSDSLGSDQIRERILGEIRSFAAGAAQADDMTMVVLKVA